MYTILHALVRFGHLLRYLLFIAGLLGSADSLAQQTIDTQALSVTSICAGSQVDVPGLRSFFSESVAVELSDGGDTYTEIPSVLFSASGRYEITYRATIPASTPAGTNYRIRLVAKNPSVSGTPSPTILTVNARPVPPTVDALISDCQYISPSAEGTSTIFAKVIPDAIPTLYNESLVVQQVNNAPVSLDYTTFQIPKTQYFSEKYVYPVKEMTFYLTQSLNSCESEKAKTVLRILYRPITGPIPVNAVSQEVPFHLPSTYYGKLAYCQGAKASSLNVNGHAAPPENYQVVYKLLSDTQTTTTPPTPNTSIPSTQTYELALNPIDPTKGCSNYGQLNTRLTVTVTPTPSKPTVSVTSLTLCQSQVPSSLSAVKTDTSASLVWYGTNATGGTGTIVATKPPTDAIGTFKYYVVQKVNDCESERAEIVVEVKPSSPASATFIGNQTIFQGQPASLSVAFSGYSPWEFSYRDSTAATGLGTLQSVITSTNPYAFTVSPQKTTVYVLTSVSNVCGPGALTNRLAVVTVTPLLSTDDPALADAVEVYPVPATTTLTVHIKGLNSTESAWIELMDESGRKLNRQETRQPTSLLRLDSYPAGTYLLHILLGDRMATKRIVKY